MKKIVFATLLGIAIQQFSQANAQTVPSLSTGKLNAGNLLSQLAGAIKPSSFLSSWSSGKAGWLSKVGKISNVSGLASSISSLAGFIKPGMFKNGFNLNGLQQAASSVKTMTDAAGLLKNLEGGLKPEAMTGGWTGKRDGWLKDVEALK